MKYIIFLSALIGIVAAKDKCLNLGGCGEKCLNEGSRRCSHDRNQVEQCINIYWTKIDFCQHPRFGLDKGFCTEEPIPACRKPTSPVEVVWDPPASLLSAAAEKPTAVVAVAMPSPKASVQKPAEDQGPSWM